MLTGNVSCALDIERQDHSLAEKIQRSAPALSRFVQIRSSPVDYQITVRTGNGKSYQTGGSGGGISFGGGAPRPINRHLRDTTPLIYRVRSRKSVEHARALS